MSLSNVTYSGLGRDIAWNAAAFVPSTPLSDSYVAMGDSYSSGEGLSPYDPDSAYNYGPDGVASDAMVNSCHRSGPSGAGEAYPDLIDIPGKSGETFDQEAGVPGSGVQANFIACSGEYSSEMDAAALDSPSDGGTSSLGMVPQAPMTNTYWGGPTSGNLVSLAYNELPQVNDGVLNGQTTLVTLTAGGDDVRFAPTMQSCVEDTVEGGSNCLTSGLGINGVSDPAPLDQYEPTVIEALEPHLQQLYADIARLAPDAMVVVLGYPRLFDGDDNAAGCEDARGATSLSSKAPSPCRRSRSRRRPMVMRSGQTSTLGRPPGPRHAPTSTTFSAALNAVPTPGRGTVTWAEFPRSTTSSTPARKARLSRTR